MAKKYSYTTDEKMQGLDLHGLPCRIPKPTAKQAKCSHSEKVTFDDGYEGWDGWVNDWKTVNRCLMEDIPGTNNIKCPICGYTRRY